MTSEIIPWMSSLFVDTTEYDAELAALKQHVTQYQGEPPVVFYGSSSIRLWETIHTDFPGVPILKLGFGGSTLAQCAKMFQPIVLPAKPRALVFYAGDNDIAQGRTPEAVWHSFCDLFGQVNHFLPDVPVAYIAIKPSPARWHLIENVRAANRLIRAQVEEDRNAQFANIFPLMLADGGTRPRSELFTADHLHMNHAGYAIWAREIQSLPGILHP